MLLRSVATPIFSRDEYINMCSKWMDKNQVMLSASSLRAMTTMSYELWKDKASDPAKIWQAAQSFRRALG